MRRNIPQLPLDLGGANMVNIESFFSSLKAAWLPKILNSKSSWSCLGSKYLSELSLKHKTQISNFRCDKIYNIKELANLPDFYKDSIYAKSNITNKPDTLADVLEQPLWGNKHITIYDKDTRRDFKECANSNLLHVLRGVYDGITLGGINY